MNGYPLALAITLAVETPIVAAVFPGRRVRLAITCAAATTATHLLMHLVLPGLLPGWASPFVVGEVFATVVEALAYLAVGRDAGRALVASAVANSASLAAGLVVFR